MMTDKQAIEAARLGRRVLTPYTLFAANPSSELAAGCPHNWRTVACDGDTDVVECSKCGLQRLASCNFDEDMA